MRINLKFLLIITLALFALSACGPDQPAAPPTRTPQPTGAISKIDLMSIVVPPNGWKIDYINKLGYEGAIQGFNFRYRSSDAVTSLLDVKVTEMKVPLAAKAVFDEWVIQDLTPLDKSETVTSALGNPYADGILTNGTLVVSAYALQVCRVAFEYYLSDYGTMHDIKQVVDDAEAALMKVACP